MAVAIRSRSWAADLDALSSVVGAPTFVDGSSWAQFDHNGSRLCLCGPDQGVESVAVLLKVDDVAQAAALLESHGFQLGVVEQGAHEERLAAVSASGLQLVVYRPTQTS